MQPFENWRGHVETVLQRHLDESYVARFLPHEGRDPNQWPYVGEMVASRAWPPPVGSSSAARRLSSRRGTAWAAAPSPPTWPADPSVVLDFSAAAETMQVIPGAYPAR